jgi:hypothetical protein
MLLVWTAVLKNVPFCASSAAASRLPSAPAMTPPHDMDCPECTQAVAPMPGSTWAIAWYSCGQCGTFWYTRLRVGPDSGETVVRPMLGASPTTSGALPVAVRPAWTIDELEAEADALRQESDNLPTGNLDALRLHLEKLKVLADAINQRLEARVTSN